jgi:hypothetical protein
MKPTYFLEALDQLKELDPVIISYLKEVGPQLSDELRARILQEMQSLQKELAEKQEQMAQVYVDGAAKMQEYARKELPKVRHDVEEAQQTVALHHAESQLKQS